MEIARSAVRPGNEAKEIGDKGRAFGSGEAQVMQSMAASAPNAMSAKLPLTETNITEVAVDNIKALVSNLLKAENGAAKSIIISMDEKERMQVVRAFAEIYTVEPEYSRREKALKILCCTLGICWNFVDGWRTRFHDTGEIKLTSAEEKHVIERFEHVRIAVEKETAEEVIQPRRWEYEKDGKNKR
jgi:hypothetical protein